MTLAWSTFSGTDWLEMEADSGLIVEEVVERFKLLLVSN